MHSTQILFQNLLKFLPKDSLIIKESIHEIKAMLHKAKIHLDTSFEIEYSHHYGIKNFRKDKMGDVDNRPPKKTKKGNFITYFVFFIHEPS